MRNTMFQPAFQSANSTTRSYPLALFLSLVLSLILVLPHSAAAADKAGGDLGFTVLDAPAGPGSRTGEAESVMVIEGRRGIQNAKIPEFLRTEMLADFDAAPADDPGIYFINPEAIAAIERTLASGQLDPFLEAYVESTDVTKGSCGDQIKSKSKNLNLDWNGLSVNGPVGPFQGNLTLDADVQGDATVVVRYRVKRFRLLFWCIPYWVKFHDVRTFGDASFGGNVGLTGSISNIDDPWLWTREIAKPHLGSLNFWVGPVFVHLGFKLPITAGLQLGVSATASANYETGGEASGHFDYTCNLDNCSGSSSFSASNFSTPGNLTASIEGRADVRGYLDVGVRAYLYAEWLAYAQIGVRPQVFADLWGYYGNTCGDADCDGVPETVSALTANLDWQVFLTAKADTFFTSTKEWNDLWHTPRYHIGFFDLIGSSALEPLVHGVASVVPGTPATFDVRMRSCWPYEDFMTYNVEWPNGQVQAFSNPPYEAETLQHTFNGSGPQSVAVTAVSDSHGRTLGNTTTRWIELSDIPQASPTCSVGTFGPGAPGSDGGIDADNPVASLQCTSSTDDGSGSVLMACQGSAFNGSDPYTYHWKYDDGPWFVANPSHNFFCQNAGDSIHFKVTDTEGRQSNETYRTCPSTSGCNGGPSLLETDEQGNWKRLPDC